MNTQNDFPRRNVLELNKPAELVIRSAIAEIEMLPGDVRLTKAIILLVEAQNLVSDYIDSNE